MFLKPSCIRGHTYVPYYILRTLILHLYSHSVSHFFGGSLLTFDFELKLLTGVVSLGVVGGAGILSGLLPAHLPQHHALVGHDDAV